MIYDDDYSHIIIIIIIIHTWLFTYTEQKMISE